MLTNRTKTVYDFASMLGVSYRTVYRYMDLFQEAGLLVEKLGGGVYKIDPCSKPLKTLRDMLNAQVGGGSVRESLRRKALWIAKKMIYGYLRVSSDEQDVNSQKQGVVQFAQEKGWTIDKFISDSVTFRPSSMFEPDIKAYC